MHRKIAQPARHLPIALALAIAASITPLFGFVAYNDHESGPGTHANTTTYAANGISSGPLRDIGTGEDATAILTASEIGVGYASQTAPPADGTDAGDTFNGYVDFSPGIPHSLELSGGDSYTLEFSNLESGATYRFTGTAVRGVAGYTDRWTLVRIEGADSFTAAHSTGNGIVTDGLADNEVAVWTGDNSAANQGFVANWTGIDPGADGEFTIVSMQYQGPTPGVGSGNSSGGSKGYGLHAIRLEKLSIAGQAIVEVNTPQITGPTTATISGTVLDIGTDAPAIEVFHGTTDGGSDLASWESSQNLGLQTGAFSSPIAGLAPAADHFARVRATNAAASVWVGPTITFTTPAALPTIENLGPSEVSGTAAVLRFAMTDDGGETPGVELFIGGSDGGTDPQSWERSINAGTVSGSGEITVTGLQPGTTYFQRAKATNSAGETWTETATMFTTSAVFIASVSNTGANEVSQFTATLSGVISETGGDLPEITLFHGTKDAGETSNWEHSVDLGKQDGAFTGFIDQLAHDTLHHFIFRATNLAGEAWSEVGSFTTLNVVPPSVAVSTPTSVAAESAVLRGEVLDTGGAETTVTIFHGTTDGGTDPGQWEVSTELGLSNGEFAQFVSGLLPETIYHARVRGTNAAGTGWSTTISFTTATFAEHTIVINEVHYAPADKTRLEEFIELHNASESMIDVSGWRFSDGVDHVFPSPTTIAPGAYHVIAQDASDFEQRFGVAPNGVWEIGDRLSNGGETITLRNIGGERVDEVDYQSNFPWPSASNAEGSSMELLNPTFDNDLGGSWRASIGAPTPGAPNSVHTLNDLPAIRQVNHSPESPTSRDAVTITAKITDADGITEAWIDYQIVRPGDYIEIGDPRYQTEWTRIDMNNAGLDGDAAPGDFVFTATLPEPLHSHRNLVRYRISAIDGTGASVRAPYADDPQPNFAFFVYDGVPAWTGSARPGVAPSVTYSGDMLSSIPVYHLITTRSDHEESQHIPDATSGTYGGSNYLWQGTLVYDGRVYDHIRFRARGGVWRYSMGKNMWKFDFNRGHGFEARDDFGRRYDTRWDKLNFSALIQQGNFQQRGEQGMFEAVGFKLHNLADNPAPNTHYVHFRIIEHADENGPSNSQFDDDFQGLYLAVEQLDGRFLDEHGLPDGNLYKMEGGTGELNNQGPNQPTNKADLNAFLSYTSGSRTADWWRQNLDLDQYYSFRSIASAIHDYDIHAGKNYFFFHNPENDLWSVINWDLDLTWTTTYGGGGERGPLSNYVLPIEEFGIAHRNRMREIRDLLFNPEQVNWMIDETVQWVHTPGTPSFVDADRAMWDYNPILASSYVNSSKAGHGRYYEAAQQRTFASMIQHVKNYVVSRSAWIDSNILSDDSRAPRTPTISHIGAAGFPIDDLRFSTTAFQSTVGESFVGMEWRVARITDFDSPDFDPLEPRHYEMTATWESGVATTFASEVHVPHEALKTGRLYRARVRMLDTAGRWSHWSDPVQFSPAEPITHDSLRQNLIITEIMYNPAPKTDTETELGYANSDFEFIEIWNRGEDPLDLADVRFTKGIDFDFISAPSTIISPGAYILVVRDQAAFEHRHGPALPIAGEYKEEAENKLSNEGDTLKLSFGNGLEIHEITYGVDSPWPATPSGIGPSLTLRDPEGVTPSALADPASWRESLAIGGSPGRADDAVTGIYQYWVAEHFSPSEPDFELISAADFDADLDGLTNAAELALGSDPRDPESRNAPAITLIDNGDTTTIRLTFPMRSDLPGVSYRIQSSDTLAGWADDPGFVESSSGSTGDSTIVEKTIPALTGELFIRVLIEFDEL